MSGKATMTVIGNGLALYDNGAGVRGVVNMATPSTQAMGEQGYAMSNSFAFGGSNVSLTFQSSAL